MLKKHRNSLLNIIREAGLDPREFNTIDEEIDGCRAFRLQMSDGLLFFAVKTNFVDEKRKFDYKYTDCRIARFKPPFSVGANWGGWYDFDAIERVFKSWLGDSVKKYLAYLAYQAEEAEDQIIPDLWAQLDSSSNSPVASQVIQNTLFSSEEQKRISESLNEFAEEIKRREILTKEQLNLLNERIEYLVEASKRLGRKDWLAAAAGALIGYTFQVGLTANVATQIIHLAGEAIRWIGHTPLLLP